MSHYTPLLKHISPLYKIWNIPQEATVLSKCPEAHKREKVSYNLFPLVSVILILTRKITLKAQPCYQIYKINTNKSLECVSCPHAHSININGNKWLKIKTVTF